MINNTNLGGSIPTATGVSANLATLSGLVSKVFAWMTAGLIITAATALFIASEPQMILYILRNQMLFYGLLILEVLTVATISAAINKISSAAATGLFILYSVMNGITLSIIFVVFTGGSIASAFLVSALTFGAMALYGYTTKRDLTTLGNIAFMGLIGVLIAGIVNMFVQNDMFGFIVSCISVLVFMGLTAYDMKKIKAMSLSINNDLEIEKKVAILGALTLYLDFINLFLNILRIFGKRR